MPKEVQQHVEGHSDPGQREEASPLGAHDPNEMVRSAILRSAGQAGRPWIICCGYTRLFVQDHAEEATVDR